MQLAAALSGAAVATPAAAVEPGYYVVTPYADPGLRTIDFRYWTVKMRNAPAVLWPEFGVGYGVGPRWTTYFNASYIGSSRDEMVIDTISWQNDVLLTQGEYPFDLALHTRYIRPGDGVEPESFEAGPVFQTDIGRTQLNANLFVERALGGGRPAEMKYQWQARHRLLPRLHVGLQGFGEVGPWNDWLPRHRQSHRAGPAIYGTLRFGQREAIQWQAAWLQGSVWGQHAGMFSMRVAYQF